MLLALEENSIGWPLPVLAGTAEDKAFAATLPDTVRVYRGCSKDHVRGLPWTTDRAVAAGFARGFRVLVPNPVIATADIAKGDIFAVFQDRSESEVIVRPSALHIIDVTEYVPPVEKKAAGQTR